MSRSRVVVLLVSIGIALGLAGSTSAAQVTERYSVDFGHSAELQAVYKVGNWLAWAEIGYYAGAGISLPVSVLVTHPDSLEPGRNAEIQINMEGGSQGSAWFGLHGWGEAGIIGFTVLRKDYGIPKTTLATFLVPLGVDQSQLLRSNRIPLQSFCWGDTCLDVSFQVELGLTTTTHVDGTVSISGSAIASPSNEPHRWYGTVPYAKSVPIRSDARYGDSMSLSISDCKYIIESARLQIKSFWVIVGYREIPLVGSDPEWIVEEIPLHYFIGGGKTGRSTETASDGSGVFFDASGSVPVSGVGGKASIGLGIGGFLLVAGIAVGFSLLGVFYLRKRRRTTQQPAPSGVIGSPAADWYASTYAAEHLGPTTQQNSGVAPTEPLFVAPALYEELAPSAPEQSGSSSRPHLPEY